MLNNFEEINLNSQIFVELNELGREILMEYYKTDDETLFKSTELDGFYELSIWQFMDIFGGKSYSSYNAPYSCVAYRRVK